jgi:uncharacterized protein (DUF305 family)
MEAIHHDLEEVKPASLGVSAKDMGMQMTASTLRTATPFDREFIDMMIPHHQGAIRMARAELANGKSKALKNLAEDVVAAQAQEIVAMNAHLKEAFGAPSPGGGAPAADERGTGMGGHAGH